MRLFSTHKEQKTYYSSGEIETIFQTLNNKKDGPEKIFHKNGQLKAIVNFKNGKQINEKINSYDEQGNLIRSVEFKNGFLNGPFEEFYSSGNLKTVGNYKDNNIVEKKVFDENGILKYHYVKSNSEITVKSLSEFKNELKRIIKMNYFDNLEIEIGIPKWSVFTPINVKGVYKDFNFYGIINENCKWHDFESYYENPNDFYKDLEEIKFDNLNIDFINELTKNGNCIIDFPIENYDYFNLIWEDSTPDEIQNDFTQITDFTKYCEKCEFGNISEPQIKSFSVLLKNSESEITYELKWERNSDNKNYIAEKMDLLEEKILALYSNLHKSDIKNRISNIKNTNI
ncbi:MAG: hypothetical protein RLY43_800, partial [Bacteroidota bacterium]